MTIITAHSSENHKPGFSLAEVMVAMVILGIVLAGTAGALVTFTQGSHGLVNYVDMNNESRIALEYFGRDVRSATSVSVKDADRVVMKTTGSGGSEVTVEYQYDNISDTFFREEGDVRRVLLNNVNELQIKYYDLRNDEVPEADDVSSGTLAVKHIQLDAKLQVTTLKIKNTDNILSARFMMRNKDVSD